jgi:ssDNA-binding Zn-finger/Zn-ribbon topoisomerase 1
MMKVICPECKEDLDIDKNEYDEGDTVDCPECNESLKIKVKKGKFKLASDKARYFEEDLSDFEGTDD